MRHKLLRKARTGLLVAAVLVGLSYSTSVLMPNSVYATSCNCTEEKQDAEFFCNQHFHTGLLLYFNCPYNGNEYEFICWYDSTGNLYKVACD
jgi:hypothetical protein